jgi:signal transduction histidine kinase/ligand-binding sensor domain-containing protein
LFTAHSFAQNKNANEPSIYFDQPEPLKKAGVDNVRCVFKDSRNLMWIGTANGLFRYDGTNTHYERHQPGDTTSIPNNTVVSIAEDRDGNIWLGTLGGVACMNPYSFKCKVYTHQSHTLPDGNFDNKILTGPEGEVWTGNSGGLYLLDKKSNTFKRVWRDLLPNKNVSGYVNSVLYWSKDTLVMGTFDDLILLNVNNFGFKRISPLQKDLLVGPIHIDAQHRLWIGTWSEGCIIGNSTLTDFQQYKWEKDLPSGVDNIVSSFSEINSPTEHEMWIGGSWVLCKIPIGNQEKIDLSQASAYELGANKNNRDQQTVTCLLNDNENYVWTGSGTGIARFSVEKKIFKTLPFQLNGSVQHIQQIHVAGKDYICISNWHGSRGLALLNLQSNEIKYVDSIAKGDRFGSNISGLAVDKFNRVWVASLAGTFLMNDQFVVTNDLLKSKNKEDIPTSKKTNDILLSNDTVWLSCYKNGIDLYDLNLHKIKHFAANDGSGLIDDLIERIFRDHNGNIWLCSNGYFYKYLPTSARFQKYDFSVEHGTYSPNDVTELPDGHLVIATETGGLIYFDPVTEKFERIFIPLLDKEDAITSVTSDDEGNIWWLTSHHLVKYQPHSKKFTLFGEEDGLNTFDLQWIRCINGKEIYLAESGRIIQFLPVNLKNKIKPPEVIMHAVQVNDSAVLTSQPLHDLHLKYNQNKIYFEFDGINYTKPEQNQYAYKLSGIDKDWIYSNRNSVSYANISPGSYTFRVKASNYSGEWSKEYLVNLSIAPPFWKTWWFISISVLVFGTLFFLIVRYISQRNLRERILRLEKEQAIEKERNRIARDMHDDLGSGLTKIAILSEVAKTQLQQQDAATSQLENISNSSRELVDNLQNIIWVLNPRNDSLENLSAYIREYTLKFFESTDVIASFNYPNQIPVVKLSEEQRRNLFMVVKEILNNAAKHSCCKTVTIDLFIKNRLLHLQVKDNGKGFDLKNTRQFANGLINMKQRMEQINGTYEIESQPGQGTATKLAVPV